MTGDQTVLPRQRTLRALIDWSYDLLDEKRAAAVPAALGIRGGWTLEAAEAVCAGGDLRDEDIVDLLTQLVEKSLVVIEISGERYRMLDTMRHYAPEKLNESGDDSLVRAQHLTFYVALAETARPELAGPNQGEWLVAWTSIERTFFQPIRGADNKHQTDIDLCLRLAHAIRPYLINRGLLTLGLRVMVEVLGCPDVRKSETCSMPSAVWCGADVFLHGPRRRSENLFVGELGDRTGGQRSSCSRTHTPAPRNDLSRCWRLVGAREHLNEAVALARELGNERELAAALNALAMLHRLEGDLSKAGPLCEEALLWLET